MKIVRTIVWVLLLVALVIFSAMNWKQIDVKIWEGLLIGTKLPAVVVISFLIGWVPMWLLHRASRWNYERHIASLENAARAAAMAAPVAEPAPEPAPEPPAFAEPLPEEPPSDLSPTDETKPTL